MSTALTTHTRFDVIALSQAQIAWGPAVHGAALKGACWLLKAATSTPPACFDLGLPHCCQHLLTPSMLSIQGLPGPVARLKCLLQLLLVVVMVLVLVCLPVSRQAAQLPHC